MDIEVAECSFESLDELQLQVKKRQFKQRPLTHFTMRLGNVGGTPVEIGLDLYSLNVKATKSATYNLDSRNLEVLKVCHFFIYKKSNKKKKQLNRIQHSNTLD